MRSKTIIITPDEGVINLAYQKDPGNEKGAVQASAIMSPECQAVPPENKGFFRQYGGIGLTILASLALSTASLAVKVLKENYNLEPSNAGFWRYTGIFVISLPLFLYHQCCALEDLTKHGSVFYAISPLKEKWGIALSLLVRI